MADFQAPGSRSSRSSGSHRGGSHPAAEVPKQFGFILAGWLVPGLGHVLEGDRKRGVGLFVLIAGAFMFGLVLSGGRAVSKEVHPVSFYAQMGFASGALIANAVAGEKDVVRDFKEQISVFKPVSQYYDAGILFCNIAGLLNVLAVLHLIEYLFGDPANRSSREQTA